MKSLGFLTHQEIFNHTVQHLFSQAQASLLPRGGGAYRGYCGGFRSAVSLSRATT
jgi:hypothetical protein